MAIASKAVGLILFFFDEESTPRSRVVSLDSINVKIPWGFFDGAAGGDPVRCGRGVVLHLDAHNFVHSKAIFGQRTDNYAKLSALRLLMIKALEWGAQSIQIFGDSKLTICWATGSYSCNVLRLCHILDEILLLKRHFGFIYFTHVYREENMVADSLSREGAQLQEGEETSTNFLRDLGGFYHRPYRDLLRRPT